MVDAHKLYEPAPLSGLLMVRTDLSSGGLEFDRLPEVLLLAPSGGWEDSGISQLSGEKRTSGVRARNDASDPKETFGHCFALPVYTTGNGDSAP